MLITFGLHLYERYTKKYIPYLTGKFSSSSSFAHEVVLVKFELQTRMEHLSSCRSRVLVVFVLINLQFSVYS